VNAVAYSGSARGDIADNLGKCGTASRSPQADSIGGEIDFVREVEPFGWL
jgi:hypothetical protein